MVWGIILVYCVALVVRSTYENFSTNREIATQKARIVQLEAQKKDNELALIYYRSNAFREIEARRRLNLRGPNEHVVALPGNEEVSVPTLQSGSSYRDEGPLKPWKTWWNLFFVTKKTT